MGFIGEIVKETLEEMPEEFLTEETGKEMASQRCEEVIIANVIYQFATMLGGTLEFDDAGQAVVYTNHFMASQSTYSDEKLTEEDEEESP